MPSALNNNGKDVMLDQLGTDVAFLSVHNVDAPTDNTTEPSGGSPAYARKAASWSSASGGSKALSGSVTFDIPAAFTVHSIGLWSAATNGTLYGYWDVTNEAFAGQGTYTLTSGSVSL